MNWGTEHYVSARALVLIRALQFRELLARIVARFYERSTSIGLCRDVSGPVEIKAADIPITLQPIQKLNVPGILDVRSAGLSADDLHDINVRLQVLATKIPTCYVGLDPRGIPCYIQWLIGPEENERLRAAFHGWFLPLEPDEILMEYLYVHPAFRGRKIMQHGVTELLALARQRGARRVLTFIPDRNPRALQLHLRLGFWPFTVRTSATRLFKRSISFEPITGSASQFRADVR